MGLGVLRLKKIILVELEYRIIFAGNVGREIVSYLKVS
jgi:hypothetical protein